MLYANKIAKHVEQISGGEMVIACGSLYRAIAFLQNKGLISSCFDDQNVAERNGAREKYYTLTLEGEDISDKIITVLNKLENLQVKNLPMEIDTD